MKTIKKWATKNNHLSKFKLNNVLIPNFILINNGNNRKQREFMDQMQMPLIHFVPRIDNKVSILGENATTEVILDKPPKVEKDPKMKRRVRKKVYELDEGDLYYFLPI